MGVMGLTLHAMVAVHFATGFGLIPIYSFECKEKIRNNISL
jgi:hypothetical protein